MLIVLKFIAYGFLVSVLIGSVLFAAMLGVTRCRKCGRWHDCVQDEESCEGGCE